MNEKERIFIVELDDKANYTRFALTEKDFKEKYPDTDIERMRKGDADTLGPMVHIWAEETAVGSKQWNIFFTDMTSGLPVSDRANGNWAYVDIDSCSETLKEDVNKTIKTAEQKRVKTLEERE